MSSSDERGTRLHSNGSLLFISGKNGIPSRDRFYKDLDVQRALACSQRIREEFVFKSHLQPPQTFRLIDCRAASMESATAGRDPSLVLINWHDAKPAFTAVSHTWGMPAYMVFDCECSTICVGLNSHPRCHRGSMPCAVDESSQSLHKEVKKDILGMVSTLWQEGGAEYVWHDGVCIAQHDKAEVEESIKHMGWVYSHATQTVVFLDYVGSPMAPIRHADNIKPRWHTRVWTVQEAALSKRRRYYVRVGSHDLVSCQTLEEFEEELATWYDDSTSQVKIIEEPQNFAMLVSFRAVLYRLIYESTAGIELLVRDESLKSKAWEWFQCIYIALYALVHVCIQFPSLPGALMACSHRDSKHPGDRINSILTLAGVKDFVAPKEFANDGEKEQVVMESFSRAGSEALAVALFAINFNGHIRQQQLPDIQLSWLPDIMADTLCVAEPESIRGDFYGIVSSKESDQSLYDRRLQAAQEDFCVLPNGILLMQGCFGIAKVCLYLIFNPDRTMILNNVVAAGMYHLCCQDAEHIIHMDLTLRYDPAGAFDAYERFLCAASGEVNGNGDLYKLGMGLCASNPDWVVPFHVFLAFSAHIPIGIDGSCRALLLSSYEDDEGQTCFSKLAIFGICEDLRYQLLAPSSSSTSVRHVNDLVIRG